MAGLELERPVRDFGPFRETPCAPPVEGFDEREFYGFGQATGHVIEAVEAGATPVFEGRAGAGEAQAREGRTGGNHQGTEHVAAVDPVGSWLEHEES